VLEAASAAAGQKAAPGKDLYGDPVPAGAVRLGTTRLREGKVLSRIAFSPDGKLLASSGAAQELADVRLWDAATGRLVRTLAAEAGAWDFAFLPKGGELLTVGPDRFGIHDARTGKALRSLPLPQSGVRHVAVSPNGKLLLATIGSGPKAVIVDLATGTPRCSLDRGAMGVFSPDGRIIAAAWPVFPEFGSSSGVDLESKAYLDFYDAATGRKIRTLAGGGLFPSVPAFGADGKLMVWSSPSLTDRTMRIEVVEAATGKVVKVLGDSPGAPAMPAAGAMGVASTLACSPDGRLVAAPCGDRTVRLWDVETGLEVRKIAAVGKLIAFSPDGKTLAVAGVNVVELWDVATGEPKLPDVPNRGGIASACFSPDGRTVATACEDRAMHLWDAATGSRTARLTGHTSNLSSAEFCPDGRTLVSSAFDRTVRTWDVASGREKRRIDFGEGWPHFAAFLGDGRRVCVAAHPGHVLWDAAGKVEHRWTGSPHGITSAAVAPLAALLAIANGDGQTLDLWRIDTGAKLFTLRTDTQDSMQRVCFSPFGDTLAYATGLKIVLAETCSGKVFLRLARPSEMRLRESALAISPDGRVIATVGPSHRILLLSAVTGDQIGQLPGHRAWIRWLAFSPAGGRLVSTCNDTTALVWDVSQVRAGAPPRPGPLGAAEVGRLWERLCGDDAQQAYQAMWALVAGGDEAAAMLASRLKPAEAPDARRVAALIARLGADRYKDRTEAFAQLRALGGPIEPELRRALKEAGSDEAQERLRDLIAEAQRQLITSGHAVGSIRAVGALERIGTQRARLALRALAAGAPAAPLTRRAQTALQRMACSHRSRAGADEPRS
jgi:WD40 repeat protein